MAENEKVRTGSGQETATEPETAAEAVAEAATEAGETLPAECEEVRALQEELEKVKADLAASNDKYLRMLAEYDNYRKRSAKERETVYTDAVSDTIKNILPIGDNLARAAQFTDPESVAKGIAMMQKSFDEALGKLGITEIESQGVPFDPQVHNAVMHVEDEEHGEGEIVEVFQKGYRRGDRVIRCAMVKVAN